MSNAGALCLQGKAFRKGQGCKVGESQDKLNPCGWTRPMQVLLASDLDGGGTLQQLTLC